MKICLDCGEKFDNHNWNCPTCRFSPETICGFPAFSPKLAESNDGFNPDYFQQLATIEPRNFWFSSRNRIIIWAIKKYFPNAKKFLEIGCGTGFVISAIEKILPYMSIWGSEIYSSGLAFAHSRLKKANLFQMDARRIPFENEFDLIGAFDVLEHIEEDTKVLSQIYRAVKPGGGLIVTVPQHMFLWSRKDEIACHVRRYSSTELKEKFESVGFSVERITSFVTLLLPFMLFSRLFGSDTEDDLSELKLNRVLNFLFERVMDLERCLIRYCGLPMGGSLLVVARKNK